MQATISHFPNSDHSDKVVTIQTLYYTDFLVFSLIVMACSNAYMMSIFSSYEREIVDGGTPNKIWIFIVQMILLSTSVAPLWLIFPGVGLLGSALYYGVLGFSGLVSYVASICHANQIKRNKGQNEEREALNWSAIEWNLKGLFKLLSHFFVAQDKLVALPFNLHNNKSFERAMMFVNQNVLYGLGAIYLTAVVLAGIYLSPIYALAAVTMFAVDRCYQQGWFPKFLETPYFLVSTFLMIGYFSGFDSWFNIIITTASITFTIYDYIQTHLRGVHSPTSLFPIASKEKELSLDRVVGARCDNKVALVNALGAFRVSARDLNVTFNHFHASYELSERVFANAPQVDFSDYSRHFNQLDFSSPAIKSMILNEMAVHDKFNGESLEHHRQTLKLPENSSIDAIYVAYLKSEINHMVKRLTNISYRDLNNQQVNALQGQARHLLNYLNTTQRDNEQSRLLISLAVSTGSHCNRIYLEMFSELSQDHYPPVDLTLKEQVIFDVQSVRENAFRVYYFNLSKRIGLDKVFDLDDYHTYENIVVLFGRNFYLRNTSLSQRVRSLLDFLFEKYYSYVVFANITKFSDVYNVELLLDEVLHGKLHSSFLIWCEKIYPNCYNELILDEDYMVDINNPDVKKLALLMLLDCGIVELKDPYVPATRSVPPTQNQQTESPQPHYAPLLRARPPVAANNPEPGYSNGYGR